MKANAVVPYQKQLPAVLKPLETSVVKHIKQIEKVVENTSGNYMVSTQVTKIVDDLGIYYKIVYEVVYLLYKNQMSILFFRNTLIYSFHILIQHHHAIRLQGSSLRRSS